MKVYLVVTDLYRDNRFKDHGERVFKKYRDAIDFCENAAGWTAYKENEWRKYNAFSDEFFCRYIKEKTLL